MLLLLLEPERLGPLDLSGLSRCSISSWSLILLGITAAELGYCLFSVSFVLPIHAGFLLPSKNMPEGGINMWTHVCIVPFEKLPLHPMIYYDFAAGVPRGGSGSTTTLIGIKLLLKMTEWFLNRSLFYHVAETLPFFYEGLLWLGDIQSELLYVVFCVMFIYETFSKIPGTRSWDQQ